MKILKEESSLDKLQDELNYYQSQLDVANSDLDDIKKNLDYQLDSSSSNYNISNQISNSLGRFSDKFVYMPVYTDDTIDALQVNIEDVLNSTGVSYNSVEYVDSILGMPQIDSSSLHGYEHSFHPMAFFYIQLESPISTLVGLLFGVSSRVDFRNSSTLSGNDDYYDYLEGGSSINVSVVCITKSNSKNLNNLYSLFTSNSNKSISATDLRDYKRFQGDPMVDNIVDFAYSSIYSSNDIRSGINFNNIDEVINDDAIDFMIYTSKDIAESSENYRNIYRNDIKAIESKIDDLENQINKLKSVESKSPNNDDVESKSPNNSGVKSKLNKLVKAMINSEESPFISASAIRREGVEDEYEDYPDVLNGDYDPHISGEVVIGNVLTSQGFEEHEIYVTEDDRGTIYNLAGFGDYDNIYDMFDDILLGYPSRTV